MGEISVLVDAGKATAAAPLGPALGPLGVNIGAIVNEINEKTKAFQGIKVPVKINVNPDKSFEIKVGMPATSALIKKELKLEKGSGNPKENIAGNLSWVQVRKIAEIKMDSLSSSDFRHSMREVIGTCHSMGITIDGKHAGELQKEISKGMYEKELAG